MFLENLDYLMSKYNMSRRDLAKAVGISPSTINAWYNKSADNASIKTITDIAFYFNVSLEALINGKGLDELYLTEAEYSPAELELIKDFVKFIEKRRG